VKSNGKGVPRRKNLQFKPEGKNALHDTAIRVMQGFAYGGLSDFVAAAVVYYATAMANGKVHPSFFKSMDVSNTPPKIVFVEGSPWYVEDVGAKGIDVMTPNAVTPTATKAENAAGQVSSTYPAASADKKVPSGERRDEPVIAGVAASTETVVNDVTVLGVKGEGDASGGYDPPKSPLPKDLMRNLVGHWKK